MRPDALRVVEAVRDVVPRAVDELIPLAVRAEIGKGACLTATRIGVEALRYFGVECRPLATKTIATNARWIEWAKSGAPERGESMPDDCWSVVVGVAETPGRGLDAHVVVEVNRMLLLDLDARQLARVERGIVVPETLLLPLVDDEARGRWSSATLDDGGNVTYVALRSVPTNYRNAADWRRAQSGAGRAIRELRDRLAVNA